MVYRLTDEGKKYLKEGLPEVNLARALTSPLTIGEAAKKVENFAVAMNWAKKNGWVKLEAGRLTRLKDPQTSGEEAALKKVSDEKEIPSQMLELLISRKLVEKESELVKEASKLAGKEITALTPALIKSGLWKDVYFKPYNVSAAGQKIFPGKPHPYRSFLNSVRAKLIGMGFREMAGPMIEMEFWNFDALFQPQNHPSRGWAQTYSMKTPKAGKLPKAEIVSAVKAAHENGWKTGSTGWGYKWDQDKSARLMPRAHTTACSARQLAAGVEIPGRYFRIARCFRPDVIDATHGVEFNQTEGIVIDESLSFRSLLGLLKQFAIEFAGAEKVKFRPDYFPFTEPSVELSAYHPEMGWIELGGAGIFRPELTEPLGVKAPVIAWGIGVDRLAMFKLGIDDIRELFTRKLDLLRSTKIT